MPTRGPETFATRKPECPICAGKQPNPFEADTEQRIGDTYLTRCRHCGAKLEIRLEAIVRFWTRLADPEPPKPETEPETEPETPNPTPSES